MKINMLKDCVYYAVGAKEGWCSEEFAQGQIQGAVTGMMATGLSFLESIRHIATAASEKNIVEHVYYHLPESWQKDFKEALEEGENP